MFDDEELEQISQWIEEDLPLMIPSVGETGCWVL